MNNYRIISFSPLLALHSKSTHLSTCPSLATAYRNGVFAALTTLPSELDAAKEIRIHIIESFSIPQSPVYQAYLRQGIPPWAIPDRIRQDAKSMIPTAYRALHPPIRIMSSTEDAGLLTATENLPMRFN